MVMSIKPPDLQILALVAAGQRSDSIPSFREMADQTGRSLSSIRYSVKKLKHYGLVEHEPMTARTLRIPADHWTLVQETAYYLVWKGK